MDSLTQIVLGAACGEAVLGKKIGNKALLFGAIGGTIPDLDVFIGSWFYNNEIQSMAFHRGFMHSILFSILGTFIFGWLFFKLYDKGKRINSTTLRDWQKLFFWSIITHPILDCFTSYGTQLFYPFTNYRVAFNNISVVDPLYTIPFLICLIVLMLFSRNAIKRKLWLKIGVGISSVYMVLTLLNKIYINSVFEKSLIENNIQFSRFRTQPTLLNNILWYGVAETETAFHLSFYSLFDKESKVKNWKVIQKKELQIPIDNENLSTLTWFSDNYFSVIDTEKAGEYIYNDLRYPLLNPEDINSFLFSFKVFQKNEDWDMESGSTKFKENSTLKTIFGPMIKRLKGI